MNYQQDCGTFAIFNTPLMGTQLVQSPWETVGHYLLRLMRHMLCDPANFITQRECVCVSPHAYQETCTKTTHSSPFIALKNWNQPKSPYTAEKINKLWENTIGSENAYSIAESWDYNVNLKMQVRKIL